MRAYQFLFEAKGHLPHPEDDVFLQPDAGARAIQAIEATARDPRTVTIKWDGYPALIFGRGPDGKFTIMDKHMFNKRDPAARQLHSPEAWAQYEMARGDAARTGLLQIVQEIWPGLERASSQAGPGYYWGDLLFSRPLQNENGVYRFRANPNGITYTVDANSDVGKLLTNKQAGIAVHQYLDPNATSTDDATSLNGTIGRLQNNSNVAIVPSAMPVQPKIQINRGLLTKAKNSVARLGPVVQEFMNGAPQARSAFEQLFTTYLNRRIVGGNLDNLVDGFYEYFMRRPMTDRMRAKLTEYLQQNSQAVQAAFQLWIDIYNLKQSVTDDLDRAAASSPVQGYLQDGTQTQEGFVSNGYKFVNRMGFARQNLASRQQQVSEAQGDNLETLVIYPGGFHPFHLGHASVFDHLAKKFPDSEVFVAATDSKTERPFGYEDKEFLANQSGVPRGRFVQVRSPYQAREITDHYDPETTAVVFAVSEKDRDRFNFAPKKDGSPGYFQPYKPGSLQPMSKHGYIYIVPKVDFAIAGQQVDSASKIRNMYADGDDATRQQIIQDLYPHAKAPKRIKRILDNVLGGLTEADNPDYFGGSSQSAIPGTPDSLQPQPDPEEIRAHNREMAQMRRWMGHTSRW
jgi:hypothetical protein